MENVSTIVTIESASLHPEINSPLPKIPSGSLDTQETSHSEAPHSDSKKNSIVATELSLTLKNDSLPLAKANIKDCYTSEEVSITECFTSDETNSHSNTNNIVKEAETADNSRVADVSVYTQVSSHCSDVTKEEIDGNNSKTAVKPVLSNGISAEI